MKNSRNQSSNQLLPTIHEDSGERAARIQVVVRVRPLTSQEIRKGHQIVVRDVGDDQRSLVVCDPAVVDCGGISSASYSKPFNFDRILWSHDVNSPNYSSQSDVFDVLGQPVIDWAINGFNCCVMAHGQTGGGKTFTMSNIAQNNPNEFGLIPRICFGLLESLETLKQNNIETTVTVSHLEIYNDNVRDLLAPKSGFLKVREHPQLGVFVPNLTVIKISTFEEVMSLIEIGDKNRTMSATNKNQHSSRSHSIVNLTITQRKRNRTPKNGLPTSQLEQKISKVCLVDLAGSERVAYSGAHGERLKEANHINVSLSVLGDVIKNLGDTSRKNYNKMMGINQSSQSLSTSHIPYRNSTLTMILKETLGGNSHVIMLSTVSPSNFDYEETLSTLKYAERAKRVRLQVKANITSGLLATDTSAIALVPILQAEVKKLRQMLKDQQQQQQQTQQTQQTQKIQEQDFSNVKSKFKINSKDDFEEFENELEDEEYNDNLNIKNSSRMINKNKNKNKNNNDIGEKQDIYEYKKNVRSNEIDEMKNEHFELNEMRERVNELEKQLEEREKLIISLEKLHQHQQLTSHQTQYIENEYDQNIGRKGASSPLNINRDNSIEYINNNNDNDNNNNNNRNKNNNYLVVEKLRKTIGRKIDSRHLSKTFDDDDDDDDRNVEKPKKDIPIPYPQHQHQHQNFSLNQSKNQSQLQTQNSNINGNHNYNGNNKLNSSKNNENIHKMDLIGLSENNNNNLNTSNNNNFSHPLMMLAADAKDTNLPRVVNLNQDPLFSEVLVYYISSNPVIAGSKASEVDILLSGPDIKEKHCWLVRNEETGDVKLKLFSDAQVFLNGDLISNSSSSNSNSSSRSNGKILKHFDRIAFGRFHLFRFEDVSSKLKTVSNNIIIPPNWDFAQAELLKKNEYIMSLPKLPYADYDCLSIASSIKESTKGGSIKDSLKEMNSPRQRKQKTISINNNNNNDFNLPKYELNKSSSSSSNLKQSKFDENYKESGSGQSIVSLSSSKYNKNENKNEGEKDNNIKMNNTNDMNINNDMNIIRSFDEKYNKEIQDSIDNIDNNVDNNIDNTNNSLSSHDVFEREAKALQMELANMQKTLQDRMKKYKKLTSSFS